MLVWSETRKAGGEEVILNLSIRSSVSSQAAASAESGLPFRDRIFGSRSTSALLKLGAGMRARFRLGLATCARADPVGAYVGSFRLFERTFILR